MPFPYTFPFIFDVHLSLSADTGSGIESVTPVASLVDDEGSGMDNIRIFTGKAGYDLRLHSHGGHVSITHKEVNL